MRNFMENIESETNTTRTDNGDIAYEKLFGGNLTFFGGAGSIAMTNTSKVAQMFDEAMEEDNKLAVKNIFFLRDIRNGLGMRDGFRACLVRLAENNPKLFIAVAPFVPEIGRWDDIVMFANHEKVGNYVVFMLYTRLMMDLSDSYDTSLLAKWMPSESSSNPTTKALAIHLANELFDGNRKLYRKTVSFLRQKIGIVETKLANKEYDLIEYSKLPGRALAKYAQAFRRNGGEKFEEYLHSLSDPMTAEQLAEKVKSLFAYEIVRKAKSGSEAESKFAEAMWKALPKVTTNKKILVVRDGSGSMYSPINKSTRATMIDVANALTIYSAERLTGEFANKFITFSSRPRFVSLNGCNDLSTKLQKLSRYEEIASTNISRTYEMILNASLRSLPEDRPDTILIISDMQFDIGASCDKSTFNEVRAKYAAAGIEMPEMIYWNVNAKRVTFATDDTKNALFISGFSSNLFDCVSNGNFLSAEALMYDTLSEYDYLDEYIDKALS